MSFDAQPLLTLASSAGIDAQDLQRGDGVAVFERSPDVSRSALANVRWTDVDPLLESYGAALRLVIDYEGAEDLVIDAATTPQQWDAYRSALASNGQYRVRIKIDKRKLIEQTSIAAATNVTHFFFAASLLQLLEAGLPELEKAIWTEPDDPALILVGDTELDLAGPLLRITGGRFLDSVRVPDTGVPSPTVAVLRSTQRELVSIEAPVVNALTPWHLWLDVAAAIPQLDDPVRQGFAAGYVQLGLMSVCDRARPGGSKTGARLEFRGVERLATVTVDTNNRDLRLVCAQDLLALHSIVEWCYEDVLHPGPRSWTPQRLHFVQVRLARLVSVGPEDERLSGVLRTLAEVDATKEVFWKAFLDDTVSDYLERLRDLEVEIDSTVDAYATRSTSIIEKLTANMLTAVAALIGSFIAAAFRSPFNADLFSVTMRIYAVYLALFPAILGLSSQVALYRDLDSQFAGRKETFERILGAAHVASRLGDRVERAKKRWKQFFLIAVILYAVVVVGAWIGASELPHLVTPGS
jgi:hypothetical protein